MGKQKTPAELENPRVCRVAALPAPSERERSQWYFQRYVSHLPSGGDAEIKHPPVILPERVHNPDYLRNPPPKEMFVPNVY